MSCERAVTVLLSEGIHVRGDTGLDSVSLDSLFRRDTPTIVYAVETVSRILRSQGEMEKRTSNRLCP